jgi:hypothetical protein
MKKFLASIATVAALAVAPAFAQTAPALDPATVAATKQMLDAMKVRELTAASFKQVVQVMPSQMRTMAAGAINNDPKLGPDQKKAALAKFEKSLPKLTAALDKMFSDPALVDEMIAEMVPLYARTYTLAEIEQLNSFYQSPLGQKMLANMPKLMAESMEISNRLMAPRIQKFMSETARSLAD